MCINLVRFLTKKWNNKPVLAAGLILGSIANLIMGPETLMGLPNEYGFFIAGLIVLGVSHSFCILPIIPEFVDLLNCNLFLVNERKKQKI